MSRIHWLIVNLKLKRDVLNLNLVDMTSVIGNPYCGIRTQIFSTSTRQNSRPQTSVFSVWTTVMSSAAPKRFHTYVVGNRRMEDQRCYPSKPTLNSSHKVTTSSYIAVVNASRFPERTYRMETVRELCLSHWFPLLAQVLSPFILPHYWRLG